MPSFNRREFLSVTAGLVAVGAAVTASGGVVAPGARAVAARTLGRTGLQCSYLGIGTGIRGQGFGITDQTLGLTGEQFIALLEYAYSRGITYFDMADRYGSHHYMRMAMKRSIPRDKVMLLSKVWFREAETVKIDLERMRRELEVDCIDVVLMHCLRNGEENWPETLRPAMDVLEEAKVKGHIRAHGVSCHNFTALERAAEEPWCDVVLARINPFGVNMDGPAEKVVPVFEKIHGAGKGVIGMKILGEGAPEVVAKMGESLRFVMGLDSVDAVTIGFMNPGQLDEVMTAMEGNAAG
ncbi:MAG TPA: aldo/keto reductase [Candidatus Hydrogenedentes bacterium]|nr:MAG: 2,5-diketo-D-gluconate reductase B [Candidatus Hydrogenedentes bacterium ADurb.Bin101]HOC68820.1 aldo/keto reductase [Candidatus Hydrogenedentota bacterium]HQM99669.1 aldo/keto reductase [Candidatus Hydrogenedentota bacterium]